MRHPDKHFDPTPVATIHPFCGARYWEDATVNGQEDTDGTLIPCRNKDYWEPVIEAGTGRITNWTPGVRAKIHYKVCDDGTYILKDAQGAVLAQWDGYVPKFMSPTQSHYGDYVIMTVTEDGHIEDWQSGWTEFLRNLD